MSAAIGVLLALLVAGAWLAAFGFARLRSPLDRLHCVSFVYVACGLPLATLAFLADGASTRAFKVLFLVIVALVAGASVTQAMARAIFVRDEVAERE